ncbi:hypothetical protein [Bacillus massiliigorillae]|uniref:hypothetical protein n=1 Tax=Bacillus massiliigorillae TaxID=1243664 RepID=UPI0003A45F37|nr:hypothetical protein [Bacillus massiliigorillae]
MEIIIISLVAVSLLLIVFSFFKKDRLTDLEKNVEDLSLQHIQDIYILKKKIKILEEELLIQDTELFSSTNSNMHSSDNSIKVNEILQSQVLSLYQQGLSVEEIHTRSALSHEEIITILNNNQLRGI